QPLNGTALLNANGTVTYTPKSSLSTGIDTFTYKATDGTAQSNVATVTVAINTAPVAANDSATTNKGVPATIAVLANDTDANGDVLSATSLSLPANGTTVANANGTVTYTPKVGFVGSDSFTYKASDGSATSNVATVTVSVLNRAPVAGDDSASTNK